MTAALAINLFHPEPSNFSPIGGLLSPSWNNNNVDNVW